MRMPIAKAKCPGKRPALFFIWLGSHYIMHERMGEWWTTTKNKRRTCDKNIIAHVIWSDLISWACSAFSRGFIGALGNSTPYCHCGNMKLGRSQSVITLRIAYSRIWQKYVLYFNLVSWSWTSLGWIIGVFHWRGTCWDNSHALPRSLLPWPYRASSLCEPWVKTSTERFLGYTSLAVSWFHRYWMRAGSPFPLSVYINTPLWGNSMQQPVRYPPQFIAAMQKQLVTISLLWSFVLFLAPGPAHGNFNSGDCAIGDSPGKQLYSSVTALIS